MRRRDLLATLAGTITVGTAGCSTLVGEDGEGTDTERVTVETLDAPGSTAGTATVPASDQVTFVEFFATTCSVCAGQMETLRQVHEQVGDDVQFLSVTSQPVGLSVSKEDVTSWWREHDGTWTVAVDDGTALARAYDATSVPTAVVVDSGGAVAWSHTGRVEAATVLSEIQAATDGEKA